MKSFYYKNQEIFNRAISSLLKWRKGKYNNKLIFKKLKVFPEFQNYSFKFNFKSKEKYHSKILKINKIYPKKKIQSYLEWIIKINNFKRKILEKNFIRTRIFQELKYCIFLLFFIFKSWVLNS
jgi:hypothetical protein